MPECDHVNLVVALEVCGEMADALASLLAESLCKLEGVHGVDVTRAETIQDPGPPDLAYR